MLTYVLCQYYQLLTLLQFWAVGSTLIRVRLLQLLFEVLILEVGVSAHRI